VYDYRTGKQDWMGAGLESSPVTTSDGRLVGLVRKQDVAIR
jgi:hypothetical protein